LRLFGFVAAAGFAPAAGFVSAAGDRRSGAGGRPCRRGRAAGACVFLDGAPQPDPPGSTARRRWPGGNLARG
jgi:hypothetical protein